MKDWEYMKQKHRIPFWKTVPNEVNKSVRNFYHKFSKNLSTLCNP